MLTCAEVVGLIGPRIDGELDVTDARRVDAHLAGCPACAAEQAALSELRLRLRALPRFEPPAAFPEAIAAQLGIGQLRPASAERPSTSWWRYAAAALVGAGLALLLMASRPDAPAAGSSRTVLLLDAHLRSLRPGRQVEVVSADRHVVRPWFAGRVDLAPPVVDLSAAGFELLGGRIDFLGGRPVAALVYQRRAHIISLFWQLAAGLPAMPAQETGQGYTILRWRAGDLLAEAISDLNATELAQLRGLPAAGAPTP